PLLRRSYGTVDRAKAVHLVVVIRPFGARQRGRWLRKKLGWATHREGHHLTQPRRDGKGKGRWSGHPHPGCRHRGEGIRHVSTEAIVRPERSNVICGGSAHRLTVVLRLPIRYRRERKIVRGSECGGLEREMIQQCKVRGGDRGGGGRSP